MLTAKMQNLPADPSDQIPDSHSPNMGRFGMTISDLHVRKHARPAKRQTNQYDTPIKYDGPYPQPMGPTGDLDNIPALGPFAVISPLGGIKNLGCSHRLSLVIGQLLSYAAVRRTVM